MNGLVKWSFGRWVASIALMMVVMFSGTLLQAEDDKSAKDSKEMMKKDTKDKSATMKMAETKYVMDNMKSKAYWLGSKFVGSSHNGYVSVKSGYVLYHNDMPHSAQVVMDMNSITNTDMKGEDAQKIVKHLKNDDFFDVPNHPTATLMVKKFTKAEGTTYNVSGDMTIRGVTKPVTFTCDLVKKDQMVTGKGKFTFDRTEFNVKYNSKKLSPQLLGDKVIKDEVDMTFDFVASLTK
ncbi:MAG: YceI family protein [Proteobacteria bacterium]|nr:YceI family protein [Pseudomonadota bacterium]